MTRFTEADAGLYAYEGRIRERLTALCEQCGEEDLVELLRAGSADDDDVTDEAIDTLNANHCAGVYFTQLKGPLMLCIDERPEDPGYP